MKTIRFGIIGCGLMGKEFASAAARWCHLVDPAARPEIVAICNRSEKPFAWFTENFPTITQVTHDYKALLANPDVDAVYIALPHDLHEQTYIDAIRAGKHLMGEKPFGIDLQANRAIADAIAKHPDVFVRCVSQFPFYPAVQHLGTMVEQKKFGRILNVQTGFLHSSDLDRDKPINWKRMIESNGEYGVMGDLGMHACHVPLRAGWRPMRASSGELKISSVLSNVVTERWTDKTRSEKTPCKTWDNATVLIHAHDPQTDNQFPWTLRTERIAPGEKNSWYVEVLGETMSAKWNSREANTLHVLDHQATGGAQNWQQLQTGYSPRYATITGGIFEFGFTDAILQMWAAYLHEMVTGEVPNSFAGCVTPDEVTVSHEIFTAALQSANG